MRKSLLLVVLAAVVAALLFVPVPFLILSPGAAVPVPPRVEFAAPEDPINGELLLTTVRLSEPRAIGAILAWLDDDHRLLRRERVIPEDVEQGEFFEAQRDVFAESARVAAAVGLRAAGLEVKVSGRGAEVVQVLPDAPAAGRLNPGDVIVAVGDTEVQVVADLITALAKRPEGEEVTLTIRRDGERRQVSVRLRVLEGVDRPALGVAVSTVRPDIQLPFDVDIEQGRIGGPSAGLMIALTVFDLASGTDLVRGRSIAGTGTIDLHGRVGPVGGVAQKVAAAEDAGAEIFLVPAEEAAAARQAAGEDLRVIPVTTIDEAIAALEEGAP